MTNFCLKHDFWLEIMITMQFFLNYPQIYSIYTLNKSNYWKFFLFYINFYSFYKEYLLFVYSSVLFLLVPLKFLRLLRHRVSFMSLVESRNAHHFWFWQVQYRQEASHIALTNTKWGSSFIRQIWPLYR